MLLFVDGWGSELGGLSALLWMVFAFLVRGAWGEVRRVRAEHREMYLEFKRRQLNEQSADKHRRRVEVLTRPERDA